MIASTFLAVFSNFLFAFTNTRCNLPNEALNPFFFFPHWWEYLNGVVDPTGLCVPDVNFPNDILPIGLAILDLLLRAAGFIAVISIIVSGIQHIFSGGNPEKAASARNRIWNSRSGLGIVITATVAVTFVGRQIGGK